MKKIISVLTAASLLMALAACGKTQNKPATEKATETASESAVAVDVSELKNTDISAIEGDALPAVENENSETKPEADIDYFHVVIDDAKIVESVDGKAIIIELEFTNNTSNPLSYDGIMDESVTQNGADLRGTTILKAIDGYNPLSATEQIGPGQTGRVQKVYALNDEENDVSVTVFRYAERERGQVAKTFKLK